ncbi:NADH:flavin oxidoreductase/NADH oxidase [Punctularia strigosozonata HHB-11173 SS5]|uniref:NADH:flavin oxidoreductase/NADH oxidase n=1 Tax=Punctularia strigosozonata (strain HHB-11173) TaxID=741275 RepID=UPI000441810D|nr:NADH:flavin oxidoreductase/NADH oxidase [Punctularia strigosozonata HHB-11173 SS5]EIN05622.1 NADH:flavin oxidoreductase/NADH oxidase [Punctularia strigosozonata HHB-11173 SS5]
MSPPKLFQPFKLGSLNLAHRIVMAPLTRFRANKDHVHGGLAKTHYEQRGSVPGTLLITEATFIAAKAGLYDHVPGIWSDAQIEGWKRVVDAVHDKGSYIVLQLWALGRATDIDSLKREDPSFEVVSASDIPIKGKPAPRPLTVPEIKEYVQLYATAARNAVHGAGFDGVEIHGANGYLIDQFIQDTSNNRADEYGGSIENRSRFALEVVDAVIAAIGASRTGIRLSPWSPFNDMRMADPIPQFSYLIRAMRDAHPDMAFIHLVEPRVSGGSDCNSQHDDESNDFARDIWRGDGRAFISAGGYTREKAITVAEEKGDLIAFGRTFISNPDLPLKLKEDIPLTPYNRDTFYLPENPKGYNDYPFVDSQIDVARL